MSENTKKSNSATEWKDNHDLVTRAGALRFQENVKASNNSYVADDMSKVTLEHSSGSNIYLSSGIVAINSAGDLSEVASGNKSVDIRGTEQKVIGGDKRCYTRGNLVELVGKQIDEDLEAARKLQEGVDKIEKRKTDKIKSTKGTMVPCQVCEQEYLKKNKTGTGLFKLIRRLKIPYFGFAVDVLEWLYNTLIGNALKVITGKALMGGKTCGNKGCKNGMVESPQNKLEEGNKAAMEEAESQFDVLDKYASQLKGGSGIHLYSGDLTIKAGLVENSAPAHVDTDTYHSYMYEHQKDEIDGASFVRTGKRNPKRIAQTNPHPTVGNITIAAANKLLLQSGSPGLDIISNGHSDLKFGSVTIASGSGETVLCSNNITTLKGKSVHIDADDRSGTGGIILKASHTRAAGAFHVDGNSTVIGSLAVDGNLCAPFLVTRSMRLQTDEAGSTKTVANGAQWIGSALALTVADTALQTIMRDLMKGYILTIQGLYTKALEIFNLLDIATTIEPIPTGVYLGFCVNAAGPGTSWGFIWNFKHCHVQTPQSHTHDHTAPMGQYSDDRESWGNARTGGDHVPTPASEQGDGSTPGPKSSGSCGGGGFGFGSPNSNATSNQLARNQSYGINGNDAYGNYDFVNVIPGSLANYNLTGFNTNDFGYDENGNLTPIDRVNFSVSLNCAPDTQNLQVNPNSPTIDETKC